MPEFNELLELTAHWLKEFDEKQSIVSNSNPKNFEFEYQYKPYFFK